MQHGRFISLEGGEGVGKSTQVRRLAERLGEAGVELVVTREPGGSAGAEALRRLLVEGAAERWSPTAETLLLYAAREDHLERLIRPALRRGAWVLTDRFADSTRAYQGAGGGASPELILALERMVVGPDAPTLTLILDLAVERGLERALARGGSEQRFEHMGLDFHRRLRAGFLAIAQADPARCRVIDASGDADQVAGAVWRLVRERFALDLAALA